MSEQTRRDADGTRRVILLMGMSLDGFGAEGWTPHNARPEDQGEMLDEVWRQLESVDTFLFGRVSFEIWERAWPPLATKPESSDFTKRFARYVDDIQKVVYSHSLTSVSWRNARLVTGSIAEDVTQMKRSPGRDMVIAGGSLLAQAFGELGLIDEYRPWLHPKIMGHGTQLLGRLGQRRELELLESKAFRSGAVTLHLTPR
jgi:dihydrofolate reductase